nr:MAG TPA: hypothetical protein [Caudoviricetes sp.]
MPIDMRVEVDSTGAMFIMAGGGCYFVCSSDAREFLEWVIRDVVSE